MADINRRLKGNVRGDFFVDNSCIDCDACRQIAPETFAEHDYQSVVYRQPITPASLHRALMALVACPTGSIGTVKKHEIKAAIANFPQLISKDVYYCGFTSRHSYGASSYLIVRPQGNVLVDSPRFSLPLVKRLQDMGGVRWMFLTHKDDVADHELFHRRLNCQRVMHSTDVGQSTLSIERKIAGSEPVVLDPDLTAIPVPGHTRGHMCLLYREKFLFSGDHLAWDEESQELYAFHDYCWYSWPEQIRSMEKLLDSSFEWVLPGHGQRYHAASREQMKRKLLACIQHMKEPGY
jgi:glyoxylase-like metal-dependent hydrolase (beta-lactamase superfamily II)/ferredoxin